MQIVERVDELRHLRRELAVTHHDKHFERPLVGLTPTLGALHAGHRALIERMVAECDVGLVSLFLNPRQFAPEEDLERYPRTLERDLALCEAAGVDLAFAPPLAVVYPEGYQTTVSVGELTEHWCGATRPGHFDGVTTVVAKLFGMCQPDRAYFGEKDYQQLIVVRRMARDLDLPVDIVACPTVRDHDGLALSSRNDYLSPAERAVAPRLYQALTHLARRFTAGERDASHLVDEAATMLNPGGGPRFELEYMAVVDPWTLAPRQTAEIGDRVLAAASLGGTRLIDNIALTGTEQV